MKRGALSVLVALAAGISACTVSGPPMPGDRVPDTDLEVIDPTASPWSAGDRVALSDLEGRPVLIDFWASWCPPCLEQHAHVTEVAERYGSRIAVLGILVDDSPENALRWMEEQGAAYPTALELDDDLVPPRMGHVPELRSDLGADTDEIALRERRGGSSEHRALQIVERHALVVEEAPGGEDHPAAGTDERCPHPCPSLDADHLVAAVSHDVDDPVIDEQLGAVRSGMGHEVVDEGLAT